MTSHPSRGAWIEIGIWHVRNNRTPSHPSRGAWIEIAIPHTARRSRNSHPSRGTWIEIECIGGCWWAGWFAPLTGCVD